jgi:hypothetical protein
VLIAFQSSVIFSIQSRPNTNIASAPLINTAWRSSGAAKERGQGRGGGGRPPPPPNVF